MKQTSMPEGGASGKSPFHETRNNSLVVQVSLMARQRMYRIFEREFPDPQKVADIGVTSEQFSKEANFFETFFPHKDRITAVGVEDASYLEEKYPGLKFQQVEPGVRMPFTDGHFDVVFANAVIEHIPAREDLLFFMKELLRIGRAAFITTPCPSFPVESHTKVPLLHFLWPAAFYKLLDQGRFGSFYNSRNLKLLSAKDLHSIMRDLPGVTYTLEKVKLAGFTSNLALVIRNRG